jgi:hypothetical protein
MRLRQRTLKHRKIAQRRAEMPDASEIIAIRGAMNGPLSRRVSKLEAASASQAKSYLLLVDAALNPLPGQNVGPRYIIAPETLTIEEWEAKYCRGNRDGCLVARVTRLEGTGPGTDLCMNAVDQPPRETREKWVERMSTWWLSHD